MSPSQSSIAVVLLRGLGIASQAIMFAWLANVLETTELGVFSAIYVLWGLIRMLGPLGLDQIAMREIAYVRASGNGDGATAICRHALKLVLAASALLAILTFAILFWLVSREVGPLVLRDVIVVALATPAVALIGLAASLLRAFDRTIASQLVETVGFQALAVVLLLVHSVFVPITLGSAIAVQGACGGIAALAAIVMLLRASGNNVSAIEPDLRRRMHTESFQLWQALILIGLSARAPTFLGLWLLGPAATAVFEIAMRFGTLPTVFTSATSTTFGPILAQLHARGDKKGLAEALSMAAWLSFLPSAATLIGAIVLGPWLLSALFPPAYAAAYVPLLLVIAATTVNGMFGMSSTVLTMTGHQRLVRVYSALQLAAVLGSCLALASLAGVAGVAASVIVGFVVFDAGLAARIRGTLGIPGVLSASGVGALVRSLRQSSWRTGVEGAR